MDPQQPQSQLPVSPPPVDNSPQPNPNTPKPKSRLPMIIIVVVVLVVLGYLVPFLLGSAGLFILKQRFGPNFQYSASSNNKPSNPTVPQVETPVTLPSDFPTDVPMYSQAKLTSVTAVGQGKSLFNVTADLDPNKLEDAANFYKTELPKNGWKKYTAGSDTQGSSLMYTKDDGKLKKSISIRLETYQNKGTLQMNIVSGLDTVPQ